MAGRIKVTPAVFAQVQGLRSQGRSYNYIKEATGISSNAIYLISNSKSYAAYRRDTAARSRLYYERSKKVHRVEQRNTIVPSIPLIEEEIDLPKPVTSKQPKPVAKAGRRTGIKNRTSMADLNKSIQSLTRQVTKLQPAAPKKSLLARLFS